MLTPRSKRLTALSFTVQARRLARLFAACAACGFTLGAAVGLAYLAGVAAAEVGPAPGVSLRVATLARRPSVAALRGAPPILEMLVVTARRSLEPGAAALNPAFLHRVSYRSGPAFEASTPFQAIDQATTGRDLDCLTAAVYYEARGEPDAGQAAVAQVVLNRVRNPHFPKNVCGVVYQGVGTRTCQFSFACDGAMNRRTEPAAWDHARDVAQRALDGYVMPTVGHAVSYHTVSLGNLWSQSMIQIARVGQHIFYGFIGRAGDPGPDDASNATVTALAQPATAPLTPPATVASAAPSPGPAPVKPAGDAPAAAPASPSTAAS